MRPLIFYLHGGSVVDGCTAAHGGVAQTLADRADAVVALADYQQLLEHNLPAAISAALAGIRAVVGSATVQGLDPLRITLLGDNAGGWLAAQASIALLGSEIAVARLVLVDPLIVLMTDQVRAMRAAFPGDRSAATAESQAGGAPACRWSRELVGLGADPAALAGLPPTVVITSEADPVRDEGEAFAEALAAAGVAVLSIRARGVVHASWQGPVVRPEARLLLDVIAGAAIA